MAQGDANDFAARLRSFLPRGWMPDSAPVLGALLAGLADAWARMWDLLQYVRAQTRIATASGPWLDAIAADFFGARTVRLPGEPDDAFRARIRSGAFRERATRAGLAQALTDLTGRAPIVFEPANTLDTGGYRVGGAGYGVAGGWGSLELPFQAFVTAYRARGGGIANVAGYGTGAGGYGAGAIEWGDLSQVRGQVSDDLIYRAVVDSAPAGTIIWTHISD